MTAAERGIAAAKVEVGRTIGRYTILSRIAAGGMAEVWLAELRGIEEFRRRVVLKTIRPHLAGRTEYVKMFITEAETAARLNHPNVVPVFDLGCTDDVYFMAMEYVPGRSLREMARRAGVAKMPPWVVLHAASEVCKGLQYVHDYADEGGKPLGLVHCDVSPDNVIVSFTGNVTLVDFGIVERAAAGERDPELIKGKSRYIAPERLRGLPMDRRGDIYALGVLLYELLTGARIYDGPHYEILLRAAEGKARPPRELCAAISPALEQVILRAISPNPDGRYAEAHVLEADLVAHVPAHPEPSARGHELARYLSSLFPDASDIPFDLRRTVHGGRIVPQSYIRMTASRPPAPPAVSPVPPASWSDLATEDDEHLSIDLLEEVGDVSPASARPTQPSVAPSSLESGMHRSAPDVGSSEPNPLSAKPGAPDAREMDQREHAGPGPWIPRPRSATLVDVFAVSAPATTARAPDVFRTRKTGAPSRRGAALTATRALAETLRSETDATRRAARHFDAGLRLCRERRYGAALAEWESAVALDPEQPTYRANLKKLKTRMETER